ncbi:MAG: mechanosensitive ion channel family protein [Prevotella sp.]|jgi:small-conductance mechanosensitive channel
MKRKQILLIIVLLLCTLTPVHAVLKEKNLDKTLSILRTELITSHDDLERQSGFMIEQQQRVRVELMSVLSKSQQNALMLYSQRSGNFFDLAYACHQAIEQYKDFRLNSAPFRNYINEANIEVNRYDSLINDLSSMYVDALSPRAKIDRNVCLTLAINIRRTLSENRQQMQQFVHVYDNVDKRLRAINDYANSRYAEIQSSIFSNSGETYLQTLSHLGFNIHKVEETMGQKYKHDPKTKSDWDGSIILSLLIGMLILTIIVGLINYIIVGRIFYWLIRHNKLDFIFEWFMKKKDGRSAKDAYTVKRPFIIMATTVVSLAIILGVSRIWLDQNFFVMASGLLVEFVWLLGVILLSLLIRLNGDQIRSGFNIYLPLITIGFVVITFRIVLIPNSIVTLFFPPVLLVCAIWQWFIAEKHRKNLPKSDMFYSYMSLVIFAISVVASWIGYVLFSVQLLIWWIMQLTCILTITCFSSMLKSFGSEENHNLFSKETNIGKAWFFRMLYYMVLPIMGILSVLVSIYWAADVFNLSDTLWRFFNMRLIDTKNLTLSVTRVVWVASLYFVFNYIYHTTIDILKLHFWTREQEQAEKDKRKPDQKMALRRLAMWKNVIQVFIWGAWVLIAMGIFNINNSWIVAISAGLSTGIGFAMKDILENIYYGISLMAGRIKVGDYISIDGTRGTVKSISYVSTTLEALDGSIVTFQNSQLFSKNYKNLTKNHGNELAIIPVGVAYGSNVKRVKDIIEQAVKKIERHNYIKFIQTVFVGFGDNSIDFKILAWVDSRKQIYADSDIMEAVYDALNANNIEIPYPQRDLHIVSDATREVKHTQSIEEAYKEIEKENGNKPK